MKFHGRIRMGPSSTELESSLVTVENPTRSASGSTAHPARTATDAAAMTAHCLALCVTRAIECTELMVVPPSHAHCRNPTCEHHSQSASWPGVQYEVRSSD